MTKMIFITHQHHLQTWGGSGDERLTFAKYNAGLSPAPGILFLIQHTNIALQSNEWMEKSSGISGK